MLVILDALRSDTCGLVVNGASVTPNINRIRDSGADFTQAYSTSSFTKESAASILTGRLPSYTGVEFRWRTLPKGVPTLQGRLRKAGYYTVTVNANAWLASEEPDIRKVNGTRVKVPKDYGYWADTDLAIREKVPPALKKRTFGDFTYPPGEKVTNTAATAVAALETIGKPVFMMVWYMDTHQPWVKPRPTQFTGRFHDKRRVQKLTAEEVRKLDIAVTQRIIQNYGVLAPADLEIARAAYYEGAAYADNELGKLLARLKASKPFSNATVIVASDHGDELGEHGSVGHGRSLFNESLRSLLVMNGREVPKGLKVDRRVSTMSLHYTILDGAGAARDYPVDEVGESLVKDLRGETSDNGTLVSYVDLARSVTLPDGRKSLDVNSLRKLTLPNGREVILHQDGNCFYYDINNDPGELRAASEDPDTLKQLLQIDAFERRSALNDRITPTDTNIPWQLEACCRPLTGGPPSASEEIPPDLRALGYLGH